MNMLKKITLTVLVIGMLFFSGQFLFSEIQLPEYEFAAGNWELIGERLYQNDTQHGLAKVNIKVPQKGTMRYRFNAQFEGGMEDMHGGFGIHIFADSSYPAMSWGCGKSYLLWLNYDADPILEEIPRGLSAQVYKSYSHSYMELVKNFNLNEYRYIIENFSPNTKLPIDIIVNGKSGEVRIQNPLNENYYFTLDLENAAPMQGHWVALRTNSMAASFGLMD